MDAILTPMRGCKSDGSFTNSVRSRWKFWMNTSKASLMGMDKFPPKVCSRPNDLRWGRSFSIN